MAGTLTFNSAGAIVNQSAYTWGGTRTPESSPGSYQAVADPAGGLADLNVISLDPSDMNNWEPAPISSSGYPIVVPNFSGILDAQTSGTNNGAKYNTEINFGLRASNLSQPWSSQGSLADMNVDPYIYNNAYKANDPSTGSEFILLNPNYDASLDDKWDIDTGRYLAGGIPLWQPLGAGAQNLFTAIQTGNAGGIVDKNGNPVDLAHYSDTIELYNIETVTLRAGKYSNGADAIPAQDVTLNLRAGTATFADGTNALVTGVENGGFNTANPLSMQALANAIMDAVNKASPKNLYMYSAAEPANANLGDLTSWEVDSDGILNGIYSNGVTLPLWQITMYDFVNTQGLRREGNNLYSETRASGYPKMGAAGSSGLGDVASYTLEQSNVDMATEFVYMISTQRGYQSNSKMVTTVDTMLETVINMKR